MQTIKSKVAEKLKLDRSMQTLRSLPWNPVFQSGITSLITAILLSWFQIKPLTLIFLIALFVCFYKNRCTFCIQISPELKSQFELMKQRVVEFRQTKPTMFCAVASVCLGALAVVGHLVSGSMVVLAGLIFAAIISTKYNIKMMTIVPKDLEFGWSETLQHGYELEDEFIPEENENNLFVLERAGDLSSITLPTEDGEWDEDKSDEVPSELLIPDSIPEIYESSTDDEQDDLLPIGPITKMEAQIQEINYTDDQLLDKYSKSVDVLELKTKKYYDIPPGATLWATSSSSEESLSDDLQFPDYTAVYGTARSKSNVPSTVAKPIMSIQQDLPAMSQSQTQTSPNSTINKYIPTLMAGLVQSVLSVGSSALAIRSGTTQERRLMPAVDSSDDSDFEILEKEDFQ